MLISSRPTSAKKSYSYPWVVVTMTDEDVVAHVGRLVNRPVYTVRPSGVSKKMQYRVVVRGEQAAALMRRILPYMGKRRTAKIVELLRFHESKPDPNAARREWSSMAASERKRDEKGRLV